MTAKIVGNPSLHIKGKETIYFPFFRLLLQTAHFWQRTVYATKERFDKVFNFWQGMWPFLCALKQLFLMEMFLAQPQGILGSARELSAYPLGIFFFLCGFDFKMHRNNIQLEIWESETKHSRMPMVFYHAVRTCWHSSLWYLFWLCLATWCCYTGFVQQINCKWPRDQKLVLNSDLCHLIPQVLDCE